MKTRLFIMGFAALAVLSGSAFAGTVRLSVKGGLEKDQDATKVEKGNTTTKTQSEDQYYELDVTVSNTLKEEGTFDLEWYFFKRPLDKEGDKGDSVLCEKDKTTLTIGGMKRVTHSVKSENLSSTEVSVDQNKQGKRSGNGKTKKTINGAVYGGYVVLVRAGGDVIEKYSDNKSLLKGDWQGRLDQSVSTKNDSKDKKKGKKKGK